MSNFYEQNIKKHPLWDSKSRVSNTSLLHPKVFSGVRAVIARMHDLGHPMIIWETYRSSARQAALFKAGKTKLKNLGVHHYGLACDVIFQEPDGDPTWRGPWDLFGVEAVKIGFYWGGDWDRNPSTPNRFDDFPHIQAVSVSEQTSLFSGAWYPTDDQILVRV